MHTFPSYIANIVLLWLLLAIMLHQGMCTLRLRCNKKDHHALLSFKHAIVDPSAILSSWSDQRDCCQWTGVQCSNTTARVTMLSLPCSTEPAGYGFIEDKSHCLTGELNLSFLQLEFLNHLDLSNNDFKAIRYNSCGNSSNLHYLDLSYNDDLKIDNLQWLSCFSSLKYISFNGIDLHRETNWLQLATVLPLLSELHLAGCKLKNISSSLQHANFSSLQVLDLSENDFGSQFLPNWLFNLSVDFSSIDLSDNIFGGQIPKGLLNLRRMKYLDLYGNNLSGPIPDWLGQLEHLQYLDVGDNLFDGPIPSTLGNLSSLTTLYVDSNYLNGSLPPSLGQLLNLETLTIGNNFLTGIVSERNFVQLSNLKELYMGSPAGFIFEFDSLWIPPFQLRFIRLDYVSPKLPAWLYTQTSLKKLLILKSTISFEPQDKFWNLTAQTEYLSLHNNTIDGDVSNVMLNSTMTSMVSNNFKSSLPQLSSNVVLLRIVNNSMTGSISSLLCQEMNGINQLQYLEVTDNPLSGGLTDCWMNWKSLIVVKLYRNNLTGIIPTSLGFLSNLMSLHLYENNLFGQIPQSLKNCQNLKFLNLGENYFSGKIPNWIGHNMKILILRSNHFGGNIPLQICQSSSLTALDLSYNRISGSIPVCLCNLSALTFNNASNDELLYLYKFGDLDFLFIENLMLLTKGQELAYKQNLKFVRAIDLSSNKMSGRIPPEIFRLTGLHSLNLSHNQFTGNISEEIGNLRQLESLDLSSNQLSGGIPESLSELSFLSSLNLSFNNFNGKIPSGTQLQGFGALSYIGNPELCGAPLPKNCSTHEDAKAIGEDGKNESEFLSSFYIGMGVGFAAAFWGVCGAIFFNRTCRHAYFRFLDRLKEKIYVMVLKLNSLD